MAATLISAMQARKSKKSSRELLIRWHERLGHISFFRLKLLFLDMYRDMMNTNFIYETCQPAKHIQTLFHLSETSSNKIFSLVIMMFVAFLHINYEWVSIPYLLY